MWLFTPDGFYSVVQKRGDLRLTIRARDRRHLKALGERYIRSLGPIRYTPDADYPYRARATRAAVTQAMVKIIQDITYENFKDRAHGPLGGFQSVKARAGLMRVWSAGLDFEPPEVQHRRYQGLVREYPVSARERVGRLLALGRYDEHDHTELHRRFR